jgi:mevalonate kinase
VVAKKTYVDFETKKSIHFNLTRESHASLRIACFQRKLSMQEVFEEFSQRIVAEDPAIMRILDQLEEDKRSKIIKKLSVDDAESIYNVIESNNPLSDG